MRKSARFQRKRQVDHALLDQLFSDALLYHKSPEYLELLKFVSRLRDFAPFNAMLLHMQKPGLRFAASTEDWDKRFQRRPKNGARPLIILWPFAPVALVYDVVDTEGEPLPEDVFSFFAKGPVTGFHIRHLFSKLSRKGIQCQYIDGGDGNAGEIVKTYESRSNDEESKYQVLINRNHSPSTQFATLTHELAHLFLGHLGADTHLKVKDRKGLSSKQRELEAESVSFIVCSRWGIDSRAHVYMADYVGENAGIGEIGLYEVMTAAGRVENLITLLK